jgi:hypothetical protein
LLGVSLSLCRRSHPAGVVRRVSQSATAHAAFTFTVAGSASGAAHFRGHLCVRLRYGLETRPHPTDRVVERLQRVGFPSPCAPSYRALAFPLVGLPPTEHASLRWTHNRACDFHRTRLNTCGTLRLRSLFPVIPPVRSPGLPFGSLSYGESQPAAGLPPVCGFPARRVLRPHRHSHGPRRFAVGLSTAPVRSPSHPVGSFPCSRSWTPATPRRGRLPDLPSALCGSPTCARIGRPAEHLLFPLTGAKRVRLRLRLEGSRLRWLSS